LVDAACKCFFFVPAKGLLASQPKDSCCIFLQGPRCTSTWWFHELFCK
jgi:hypothetical protein